MNSNSHVWGFAAFLINHSFEFNVAMAASFVEYLVELYLFPDLKTFSPVIYIGILGAIFGQGTPAPARTSPSIALISSQRLCTCHVRVLTLSSMAVSVQSFAWLR
jgi:hypothetical protein